MKNNINIHEYDKKTNVAFNSRDTSSDLINTLRRKHFQPKSLNTLLPLIKKKSNKIWFRVNKLRYKKNK